MKHERKKFFTTFKFSFAYHRFISPQFCRTPLFIHFALPNHMKITHVRQAAGKSVKLLEFIKQEKVFL